MKHVKLFEQFINEKAYRLSGAYAAKGTIGKVMQSFKKEIERIKFEGDTETTLNVINAEWVKFHKIASTIILNDIQKVVKNFEEEVISVNTTLSGEWVERKDLTTGSELYINLNNDFVINIGFMDDIDANKYSRRLGGMVNRPLFIQDLGSNNIYGMPEESSEYNNIEIRGVEVISIDGK